jgi:hypothetical protein
VRLWRRYVLLGLVSGKDVRVTDWADEIADGILEQSWGAISEGDWRHNHEKAIAAAQRLIQIKLTLC